ncbi:hypothetical protein FGB62_285g04 [Gracilaria domingensis]|nr:hypothetical protein FGB62_408g01 [Gracilaria domingensis]KAI0556760.1 hypothetical protein FGB62_408g00 [Gracilaria domingensis]KAI0557602.1 hypothetical protein FGB62_285g04 [Gracilaria domingensis]
MAIRTNISVSVFNIIRYLILTIVLDVIVRKNLDSFEHFRRRLSLYRGHSVSVAGHRIDRYNALRKLKPGRLLSGSVLLLVTGLAYTAELALEYAVDSMATRYAIPGTVTRVEQKPGICFRDEHLTSGNALDIAFIAEQCVILEGSTYRLYRPLWVQSTSENDRVNDDGFRVLCEAVEDNLLFEGDGIYSPFTTSKTSPEALELIQKLSENSYKTVGDIWLALIVVNVSSRDTFRTFSFSTPSEQFSASFFFVNISGSSVQCMGFTAGLQSQDTLMVQVVGCLNGFDENSSLVLTYGSSFVELSSDLDAGGLRDEWSTLVSFEIRTRVPMYFKGIRIEGSNSRANAEGYFALLARAFPQDVINLNKYAILYRFCDEITLPVKNGTSWKEDYEFASSEARVTATVEEWAIVLAACWVVVMTAAHFLVTFVAAWKNMPDHVLGEQNILQRWAEEKDPDHTKGKSEAFLSVEGGSKCGRITATLKRI